MTKRSIIRFLMAAALPFSCSLAAPGADQKKPARLEGEYHIMVAGQEIGVERYVIVSTDDAVSSTSILQFRNPADAKQKISLETKLGMDSRYKPLSYELKSEVDGKKGTIQGSFRPNQVVFAYSGGGVSSRSGLLVGEQYTILDTNAFHHFIFLTRLFDYGNREKPQQFEVVIPQEKETGTVKISEIGKEDIQLKEKTISTTHLKMEAGLVTIQLWVDDDRIPRRISLPEKGIEVVQN